MSQLNQYINDYSRALDRTMAPVYPPPFTRYEKNILNKQPSYQATIQCHFCSGDDRISTPPLSRLGPLLVARCAPATGKSSANNADNNATWGSSRFRIEYNIYNTGRVISMRGPGINYRRSLTQCGAIHHVASAEAAPHLAEQWWVYVCLGARLRLLEPYVECEVDILNLGMVCGFILCKKNYNK